VVNVGSLGSVVNVGSLGSVVNIGWVTLKQLDWLALGF
jgi:hypothetical protein